MELAGFSDDFPLAVTERGKYFPRFVRGKYFLLVLTERKDLEFVGFSSLILHVLVYKKSGKELIFLSFFIFIVIFLDNGSNQVLAILLPSNLGQRDT